MGNAIELYGFEEVEHYLYVCKHGTDEYPVREDYPTQELFVEAEKEWDYAFNQ